MKLRGDARYLSVDVFDVLEAPNLLVLTGLNGSGKSQFLQAVERGDIVTDAFGPMPLDTGRQMPRGVPNIPNPLIVRLENHGTTSMALEEAAPSLINQPRAPATPHPLNYRFEEVRQRLLSAVFVGLRNLFAREGIEIDDPLSVLTEEAEPLAARLGLPHATDELRALLEDAEQALTHSRGARAPDPVLESVRARIRAASERSGIPARRITEDTLDQVNSWGGFSAFDPAITRVFSAYRDARFRNRMQRLHDEDDGTQLAQSDSEFIASYGEPPWVLLNGALELFGLGYKVVAPSNEISDPVRFILTRIDNGVTVQPSQLSSGERVLLRFALSLFKYDPLRVGVTMPKLLLLDEMDGSLHPEMVNRWLSAIKNLVDHRGVCCIITTHSPTTVALSPENSLYELKSGKPSPVTKQQAMNKLTFGVPTLAVDFSGRRQVLVESDTDAACYEKLASILKARSAWPRTLTFMSTGLRRAGREVGTGCVVVKQLVTDLSAAGNISVFGLIDWDGANRPSDRISVLAEGTHYALDNVLLDPLLVGALLLRDLVEVPTISMNFSGLSAASDEDLQALIDVVESTIMYPAGMSGKAEARYSGGRILQVRECHQKMNGHELEALIVTAHPSLNRYSGGGRGKLLEAIINRVVLDYPDLCPAPVAEVFATLASAEL